MFIPNDGITEIVAHFIGYFQIQVEDLRFRPEFHEFVQTDQGRPAPEELASRAIPLREQLDLRDIAVDVAYSPQPYQSLPFTFSSSVSFEQISVAVPRGYAVQISDNGYVAASSSPATGMKPMPLAEVPGSTILIASQIKYLHDDDVIVVGDYAFTPEARTSAQGELEKLVSDALGFSSQFTGLVSLTSATEMVGAMEEAAAAARELTARDLPAADQLHLQVDDRIGGNFSNGLPVEAAPNLEDVLAPRRAVEEEEELTVWDDANASSYTIDASKTPTTMHISSGGNLAWNEASLFNAGMGPSVMAVMGDYHRMDAIFQTNALRDIDVIDPKWPGENLAMGGNVLQNSASFVHHDYETKNGAPASAGGGFPDDWTVTVIDGDMIFMDWVYQYNFTSDNDTQILTTTGTHSYISSGLNLGFNQLSFANLGLYFDLVVLGGSLYDGNFISQTNVLLDSDNLEVLGNSSARLGSTATGENVLWNEASIENVGAANWNQELPSHYLEAAKNFAAGGKDMPGGFASDSALDGLGNLKVLYVAGNVYDVHHVNQVNVVGDADDLAIYEDNLLKAQDSVWKVTTGHNTLASKAKIVDYDTLGKSSYVGGEIYSDAMLVQADIVEGLTERVAVRGDQLANEVLAFLDDQTDIASRLEDSPAFENLLDIGANNDLLQTMLA